MKTSRLLTFAILCGAGLASSHTFAATVNMPGTAGLFPVDTKNFPTALVNASLSGTSLLFGPGGAVSVGPFTIAQASPSILGSDLSMGVALGQGTATPDFLVPGFGNASIVNGAGPDLAVWEAGSPSEPFRIRVSTDGGATFSAFVEYTTAATTPNDNSSGFDSNIGFVELGDFGIAANAKVDAIWIEGLFTGVGGSGPDILAAGILNAGPPTGNIPGTPDGGSSLLLLSTALLGLRFIRRSQS
jgi:hypothetical protein